MAKRRERRKWSDDKKRTICAQTRIPGVSVSEVARRYDVYASQVHKWLKDSRFAPADYAVDEVFFLPAEITQQALLPVAQTSPAAQAGRGRRSRRYHRSERRLRQRGQEWRRKQRRYDRSGR